MARQYLAAGLVDEIKLHVAPILLGAGTRLFGDGLAGPPARLERTRLIESPTGVTHLYYRPLPA